MLTTTCPLSALIFPPGVDLIAAFYGCLYLGAIPVVIRPPHAQNLVTTLPTVKMIVEVSKSLIILSIQSVIKLLKSREAASSVDAKTWPPILDIDDNPKRKLAAIANATLESTAYLDFSVSTCGRLSGVTYNHAQVVVFTLRIAEVGLRALSIETCRFVFGSLLRFGFHHVDFDQCL
jgi:acyl-CoA synthetase (AMP-forming)/AMP-acid ligase II